MRHQKVTLLALALMLLSAPIFAQPDADVPSKTKDQQILDDLIVDGSICVGFDCTNGHSFGFKTLVLKENNVQLKFDDTSTSASFPNNDWCLKANDTSNGGRNIFLLVDDSNGKEPFAVEANAPSNSLYVENSGEVGFGTANPVVELHVVDGDTPTLRLEQDGSNGFTPQTWDVAGNETNFFVRDVTNGSRLPFKIRPSSPTGSIVMEDDKININQGGEDIDFQVESDTEANALFVDGGTGNVGIGTGSPGDKLHIATSDMLYQVTNFGHQIFKNMNSAGTEKWGLSPRDNGSFEIAYGNPNVNNAIAGSYLSIDNVGDVTIAGELTADGMLLTSDLRLKSNISDFNDGLDLILKMKPIFYNFNGIGNKRTDRTHIGIGAQDLQKIAPYLIHNFSFKEEDNFGNVTSSKEYLKIDDSAIKWIIVNAIKDQHTLYEEYDERMIALEKENTELREMILELKSAFDELDISQGKIDGQGGAYLKQNIPNPFEDTTEILYFLPDDVSLASIRIMNVNGQLIDEVSISERGKGIFKLEASKLSSGSYTYSLVVDGRVLSTQKMVLAR